MQPTAPDYNRVISELIKKQIIILGPDITLAKVRNVQGLTVDEKGDVVSVVGDPQVVLQDLINHFVELSGLIVKKTMESILPGSSQIMSNGSAPRVEIPSIPVPQVQESENSTPVTDTDSLVGGSEINQGIGSNSPQTELTDMSTSTPPSDIPPVTPLGSHPDGLSELSPVSSAMAVPSGSNAIDEALKRLSTTTEAKQTQAGPSDARIDSQPVSSAPHDTHTPLIGGAMHDFKAEVNTQPSENL